MSAAFVSGELLDLHLPGVRYDEPVRGGGHSLVGEAADGEPYEIILPVGARFELTRVAPPEWPPVAGDIWVDSNAAEWFAGIRKVDRGASTVVLHTPDDGLWLHVDEALRDFGPMRLDRRRGWTPDEPAAEPEPAEPAEVDERAAFCAGLRELADFLEVRTDLPVPYQSHNQFGVPVEDAHKVAALMGVEVQRDDETAIGAELIFSGRVRYNLYASKPKPKPEPEPEPVVAVTDPAEIVALYDTLRERRAITAQTRRDLDAFFGPEDDGPDPGAPEDNIKPGGTLDVETWGQNELDHDRNPTGAGYAEYLKAHGAPMAVSDRAADAILGLVETDMRLRGVDAAPTDGCRESRPSLIGGHVHHCDLYLYSTGDHREDGGHICACGYKWPYPPADQATCDRCGQPIKQIGQAWAHANGLFLCEGDRPTDGTGA